MGKLSFKQLIRLIHIVFWVSYLFLIMSSFAVLVGWEVGLFRIIPIGIFHAMIVYMNLYFLLPRYGETRKYTQYGIGLLLSVALVVALRLIAEYLLAMNFGKHYIGDQHLVIPVDFSSPDFPQFIKELHDNSSTEADFFRSIMSMFFTVRVTDLLFTPIHYISVIVSTLLIVLITIPIRFAENWHQAHEVQREVEQQRLQTELQFLKAQVNPHFLFNTLNNLYTLAFIKSDQAAPMILKLSEMMRYMLYDSAGDYVPLKHEIQYLDSYIELQQLKTEYPQNITFSKIGDVGDLHLPPMLLVPLFENAFKHGNLQETQKGYLRAKLEITDEELLFEIHNTIGKHNRKDKVGGIGIDNIRQRLLLIYPQAHEFRIQSGIEVFSVYLSIKL